MVFDQHSPVFLSEVLENLKLDHDGIYIDGTFGRGGHSLAILDRLGPQGQLLALDRDPEAAPAAQILQSRDKRFNFVHSEFAQMAELIQARGWLGRVQGILLDLGVSSPQLENPDRGFSFRHEGPLDMRMNPQQGDRLERWLAKASVDQLAQVLTTYGEERYAHRMARAIVKAREQQELTNTLQLAKIIAAAHPHWSVGKHPATRAFLALRIFINQELEQLQQVLSQVPKILASQGRLVVISFHSLEDRIVKRFMREQARQDNLPPPFQRIQATLRIPGKPIFPSAAEINANPRARSAVLRVAERL